VGAGISSTSLRSATEDVMEAMEAVSSLSCVVETEGDCPLLDFLVEGSTEDAIEAVSSLSRVLISTDEAIDAVSSLSFPLSFLAKDFLTFAAVGFLGLPRLPLTLVVFISFADSVAPASVGSSFTSVADSPSGFKTSGFISTLFSSGISSGLSIVMLFSNTSVAVFSLVFLEPLADLFVEVFSTVSALFSAWVVLASTDLPLDGLAVSELFSSDAGSTKPTRLGVGAGEGDLWLAKADLRPDAGLSLWC